VRWLVRLGAGALILGGLAGLVARSFAIDWQPAIVLATFAPHLALGAVLGGAVLLADELVHRRRRASRLFLRLARPAAVAGATVVLGCAVVDQLPLFVSATAAHGPALVVLQANLKLGSADPRALVERVRQVRADVLTVEELTAAEADALIAGGLSDELPYHFDQPGAGGSGSGIWSRYPLAGTRSEPGFDFAVLTAQLALPAARPTTLVAAHLLPPWPFASGTWLHELTRLHTLMNRLRAAQPNAAIIVSGDFNAGQDHAQFRRLLTDGFGDATDQAGAGYLRTYPTDRVYPPLVTLDHVLARNAVARSARTLGLPGSDHRALLVRLNLQS
jgi:endonuclease/exonuclease/phosphatase (EEP) superfamily protein YafD